MVKKKKKVSDEKADHKSLAVELEGKLARALADYDNLRKRVEREKDTLFHIANKGLVGRFLTIYDMLISAQEHIGDSGIAMIIEEFKKILSDEGVVQIEAKEGDRFDEEIMEAVETEKGKKANEGKIAEIVLTGWKFREGLVIRPVKVKVYN